MLLVNLIIIIIRKKKRKISQTSQNVRCYWSILLELTWI